VNTKKIQAEMKVEAIKRGQSFIKSILEPYEDIPNSNGMKVLRNVVTIGEGKRVKDVVLRNITEAFWSNVIAELEKKYIRGVCAVGSPGIGKTATTCVLIRLLLTEKSENTVVYQVRTPRKSGFTYTFKPSIINGTLEIDVKVTKEYEWVKFYDDFNKPTTYYIIDLGETKDSCDLGSGYRGNVIIVASPDERHWGESQFRKERGGRQGIFLYYPVWNVQELIASSKYFNDSIDEEEIRNRFHRFGGVPRHIFTNNYEKTIKIQKEALAKLTSQSALALTYNDRSAEETAANNFPKGILMSCVLSDQDNGTFRYAHAVLRSDYVYEAVATKYKEVLFSMILSSYFDTYLYKSYCRTLLYDSAQTVERKFVVRKLNTKKKPASRMLGGCSASKRVDDITVSSRTNELVLFTSFSPHYRLVDFGYRKNNVYYMFYATTGKEQEKEHTAHPMHIYECVVNEISATNPSLLTNTPGKDRHDIMLVPQFEFFYLVPKFLFQGFAPETEDAVFQARNLIGNRFGKNTAVYKQWNDIVSLYVAHSV
jgi:hypothetical protein